MKRKLWLTIIAVTALAVFVIVPLAQAGWKHCKGTATMVGVPAKTTLNLDDQPNHQVELTYMLWNHTSECPEFDGALEMMRSYADSVAGTATETGYSTIVMKTGDKVFQKWSGKAKTEIKEDGSWEVSYSGSYEYIGGTGKFQGIKGKGSYVGKGSTTGFSYDWQESVWLPD